MEVVSSVLLGIAKTVFLSGALVWGPISSGALVSMRDLFLDPLQLLKTVENKIHISGL